MPDVSDFDDLPSARAADLIRPCCGASRWVAEMVARRPFGTLDELLAAADEVWWALEPDDWREAFAHHPRIGERAAAVPQDARGAAWSAGEQARVGDAASDVRAELAEANRAYERRFGHIYIVCAAGKGADELLATARARLANDPDTELRVAAEEQRKITRLRLEKLFREGPE
ncbi:OHCU decarboxylase [Gemmatirosa kalamazoonensis]|uniref:2-oxo-4-hydroxy-4-carboxy-5-ureidoimidazoline decarboxylase n=1 Tax=Gemmatirosa kalamazoonensis TaxID=861299 RepID=W0RH88_9BACT|nr:2-oxo-4-hydroxy-4-carboxy-5-ureidoimidazoline decarboxylase [Gemmatirosa kalamazoonensis]AHG89680.1 OHCU decarboxylase [Gemmatirosa kalamazoonensis]